MTVRGLIIQVHTYVAGPLHHEDLNTFVPHVRTRAGVCWNTCAKISSCPAVRTGATPPWLFAIAAAAFAVGKLMVTDARWEGIVMIVLRVC